MATLLLDCKLEQGHHPETEVRLAGICLEEEPLQITVHQRRRVHTLLSSRRLTAPMLSSQDSRQTRVIQSLRSAQLEQTPVSASQLCKVNPNLFPGYIFATIHSILNVDVTDVMLQPTSTLLSTVPLSPSVAPRPVTQAWSKDLRLYEGYKMRRNELRLRSLNRRWEHEKALSQIADIVSHTHTNTHTLPDVGPQLCFLYCF